MLLRSHKCLQVEEWRNQIYNSVKWTERIVYLLSQFLEGSELRSGIICWTLFSSVLHIYNFNNKGRILNYLKMLLFFSIWTIEISTSTLLKWKWILRNCQTHAMFPKLTPVPASTIFNMFTAFLRLNNHEKYSIIEYD